MTFWLTEGYETAKKTFKTFQVKHKTLCTFMRRVSTRCIKGAYKCKEMRAKLFDIQPYSFRVAGEFGGVHALYGGNTVREISGK